MHIFYEPEVSLGVSYLNTDESRHCIKVLRKKIGEEITIIDGKGHKYLARIENNNAKRCQFSIIETFTEEKKDFYIHIAIAPTKNIDRIEWFVEKSVEIGIDEISFLICDNSERRHLNHDRITKKAVSACKQSLKSTIPKINEIKPFSAFLSHLSDELKYIAYVDFDNPQILSKTAPKAGNYCVIIGPEGDFSLNELDEATKSHFKKVSLGPSRLRTETAGLAACHSLNLIQY